MLSFTKAMGFLSGCWDWVLNDHALIALPYDRNSEFEHGRVERVRASLIKASIPSLGVGLPLEAGIRIHTLAAELWGLALLRIRGVKILALAPGVTCPILTRVLGFKAIAIPELNPIPVDRPGNGSDTHPPIDAETIDLSRLLASIEASERNEECNQRSVLVVLANGSHPNADGVLRVCGAIELPSPWVWRRVGFGRRGARLAGVRSRRALASGAARMAFRQDPFGSIADGWHFRTSEIVILTGDGSTEVALAELLSDCGITVIAPDQPGFRTSLHEDQLYDLASPESLVVAMNSAIRTCTTLDHSELRTPLRDHQSLWAAEVRRRFDQILTI
jgi:hypothetical protein